MARPLTFSNGELQVELNQYGQVRHVYFPYLGFSASPPNMVHRIGVWVDGALSWTDDGSWTHRARYLSATPIGHTVLVNDELGVILEFEDLVEADASVFTRNIHIVNIRNQQRSIRLFTHQAFALNPSLSQDTAQYLPNKSAILHYEGRRAFVISGLTDVGQSFDQHSVGLYGDGLDGTWRDADDGELAGSAVGCGQTDSVMRFSLTIGGLSSRRIHYWLAASTSVRSALTQADTIRRTSTSGRVDTTARKWRKWLTPGFKIADQLPAPYQQQFIDSLIEIRNNIDLHGAIVSVDAAKSPLFSARTGAFVVWPLIRLGYKHEAAQYFNFCRQALSSDGYLASRYHANGSLGPSTHPYDGDVAPIQSDQTAVTLFVFSQFIATSKPQKIVKDYYEALVVPAAHFLADFTDDNGLPRPSYDFADDKLEASTYTIGVTYAALLASAELADKLHDQDSSVKWRTAAEDMRRAASESIYTIEGLLKHSQERHTVSISALFGAFMFGLIDITDERVKHTVGRIEQLYRHGSGLFGCADDPGRIDYVGSLWMAQYYTEAGRSDEAEGILARVVERVRSDGDHLPIWAHGELLSTLLDTMTRK